MRCPHSAANDLSDGDTVTVTVTVKGWQPDQLVGVAQCADRRDLDNPQFELTPDGLPPAEFCNVAAGWRTERSNAEGVIEFTYAVHGGTSMRTNSDAGVTCDRQHDCVLNLFVSGAGRFRPDAPRVLFGLTFR